MEGVTIRELFLGGGEGAATFFGFCSDVACHVAAYRSPRW